MYVSYLDNQPEEICNPHGENVLERLGLQAGGVQSHSLARMTIAPGKSSLPHFHKESEESYLILSGKAKLVIDSKNFELSPGNAVLIEPDEVHQIFNLAKEDLVFLAVCVPAWQPEDSFNAEAAPRA